jgi:hypothetical protein
MTDAVARVLMTMGHLLHVVQLYVDVGAGLGVIAKCRQPLLDITFLGLSA